jgi:hypothetical protein
MGVSMSILCIVPCGKAKIWDKYPNAGPQKAKDVYRGPFSRKCEGYAECFYKGFWCILSAKYGFLFPDEIIPESYECTFNDPATKPIQTHELRQQIIEKNLLYFDTIVVLGGRNYSNQVKMAFLGKRIFTPLSGKTGIGYMMQDLGDAIKNGKPLV